MPNLALKKITTAAKTFRKKHPKISWKSAIKKAGAMYRAGKLKRKKVVAKVGAVKKHRAKKRKVTRRAASKKRAAKRARVVKMYAAPRKRRRRAAPKKRAATRRRVGSAGNDRLITTLAIGGLAVGLLIAFSRNQSQPVYQQTGDSYRDSTAQKLISYATSAGLAASQIIALINTINQSSNSQLQQIDASISQGTPIQAYA